MIGEPELLTLNSQLDDFMFKIKIKTLHREDSLKRKIESHAIIKKIIINLLEEPLSEDNINKNISEIFLQMKISNEGTFNENACYQMLLGVLESNHIKNILKYVEEIDPEGTDSYVQEVVKQMNDLKRIYDVLIENEPIITRSLEKQDELYKDFANQPTLSLDKLLLYLQEFNNQQKITEEIISKILPSTRAVITGWERTKNALLPLIEKEEKFYEKHKIALAIASLGIVGLSVVCSLVFPPVIAGEAAMAVGALGTLKSVFFSGAKATQVGVQAGQLLMKFKSVSKDASELIKFELTRK